MRPPEQVSVPTRHAPGSMVTHAAPPPGLLSSTRPLQLSSRPLQVSDATGGWFAAHTIRPELQCSVPRADTPGMPVAPAEPPPGSPSSTMPLQSLSTPSQISPEAEPGTHGTGAPIAHAGTFRAQPPTPHDVLP